MSERVQVGNQSILINAADANGRLVPFFPFFHLFGLCIFPCSTRADYINCWPRFLVYLLSARASYRSERLNKNLATRRDFTVPV